MWSVVKGAFNAPSTRLVVVYRKGWLWWFNTIKNGFSYSRPFFSQKRESHSVFEKKYTEIA